ncbi:MAG: acetyl-CoA C-acyltransferase [Candidatus Eremiobacteraeota bacterium]|nr:acetyl-CoA C-acyltransferase [Candidatus Eremiobacteraeota bacterium]
MPLREAVVIDAVRTPIGRYGGVLSMVRPDDLAALVIRELVARTGVEAERIDDVFFGAANQSGEDNRNVARMAALLAGLPIQVPGVTVNRLCGSSLQAINSAAQAISANCADVIIAGGVESMTRAPFVQLKAERAFSRAPEIYDTTIGWRMINPRLAAMYHPISLGETAENVAEQYQISRDEQDRFAFDSQQKTKAAVESAAFLNEVVPVQIDEGEIPHEVTLDEHPRPQTTLEDLARLKPAFRKGGTVTAGNSSGINDGAAALLLCEASVAEELGLKPMARVVTSAAAGVDPAVMGLGPIPATKKALARADLLMGDMDVVEINEAFAAQSIACMRDLEMDPAKTNVCGGAIALGHPLGCSGARLATTLLHELRRRAGRYGLATMCIGVGQGITTIFERA